MLVEDHRPAAIQSPTVMSHKPCACVDCDEDLICGGLWSGVRYTDPSNETQHSLRLPQRDPEQQIHVVVSHCKGNMNWIMEYLEGYDLDSVHIISKCDVPIPMLPTKRSITTVEKYENVGRCDHSYAHYISSILDLKVQEAGDYDEESPPLVVFLKDTRDLHQPGHWNSFEELLRIAASPNGFSCGVVPPDRPIAFGVQTEDSYSMYHNTTQLFNFTIVEYTGDPNLPKIYENDVSEFNSNFTNLGEFYGAMHDNAGPLPAAVPVCYGGFFAATYSNILQRENLVWKNIENMLSRGNNIQEGHHMERSWGYLLSTPLPEFQIDALFQHAARTQDGSGAWNLNGMLISTHLKEPLTNLETK